MTASGRGTGGTSTGGDAAKVPRPIAAGPGMKALGRFYRDLTWKGVIREGGMGPGTPEMTGVGRCTARAIQDGRWIVLWDVSDPDAVTWRNEMRTGDGPWFLIEEYTMTP